MSIHRPRIGSLSAVVVLLAAAMATSLTTASPDVSDAGTLAASAPSASSTTSGPARRLVWDEVKGGRHGIHLRAGSLRGDAVHGVRKVYDTEFGFTLQLRLDGRGERVAFAPCCRSSFPVLVVVGLTDRKVQQPLATHPEFYAAGGIAWSPDGQRLVFEGFTHVDGQPARGMYTVAVDGTGLQTVLAPEAFGEESVGFGTLAWSAEGIFYVDDRDLTLIAPGGAPSVRGTGVESVVLSGNGRWLFTVRLDDSGRSLWRSRTDGSGAERVGGLGSAFLPVIMPDRTGRRLLGVEVENPTTLRTYRIGRPLSESHLVRGVTGSPGVATWY